jgi:hypothetical protein
MFIVRTHKYAVKGKYRVFNVTAIGTESNRCGLKRYYRAHPLLMAGDDL